MDFEETKSVCETGFEETKSVCEMGFEETKSVSDNGGDEIQNSEVKICSDCKTTKTPLWRGGPAGPKSLCNACGIRYRKKMKVVSGSEKRGESTGDGDGAAGETTGSSGGEEDVKVRLKVVFRRAGIVKKQRCQRRKRLLMGEEEEAAFCLMALSSGSVSVFA